jgi:hypothetical protein
MSTTKKKTKISKPPVLSTILSMSMTNEERPFTPVNKFLSETHGQQDEIRPPTMTEDEMRSEDDDLKSENEFTSITSDVPDIQELLKTYEST